MTPREIALAAQVEANTALDEIAARAALVRDKIALIVAQVADPAPPPEPEPPSSPPPPVPPPSGDIDRVGSLIHPEHVGSTTLIEDNDIASHWVPQSADSTNGPHMSDIALISNGGTGEVRIRNNRIKRPKPPARWTRSYWKPVIWEANEET